MVNRRNRRSDAPLTKPRSNQHHKMHHTTLLLCLSYPATAAAYLPSCTIPTKSSLAFVTTQRHASAQTILDIKKSIHQSYRTPTHLFSKKPDDIQDIYEQVRQQDSDWYKSLAELLGEDAAAELDALKEDEVNADLNHVEDLIDADRGDIGDLQKEADIDSTFGDKVENDQVPIKPEEKEADKEVLQQSKELQSRESRVDVENDNLEEAIDTSSDRTSTDQQQKQPSPPTPQTVQLRNKDTNESEPVASLSYFTKRGYSKEEVLSLRPPVLELIVEDDIPRPRRGVPDRWVRDLYNDLDEEDADWIVEIIDGAAVDRDDDALDEGAKQPTTEGKVTKEQKSKAADDVVSESWGPFSSSRVVVEQEETVSTEYNKATSNEKKDDGTAGGSDVTVDREYNSQESQSRRPKSQQKRVQPIDDDNTTPRRERRPSTQPRQSYYDDEEGRPRQRRSRQSTEQRRPRPRRRELVIDRGDDDSDDPPPNKFWMDLPTFRDFLRTEARLRLKILGPDWKESVLDESRWRFDLYKRWLYLLNDGVGENPLYTYGDRPAPRQNRRSRASRREMDYEPARREPRSRRGRSEKDSRQDSYSANEVDAVMRKSSQRGQKRERGSIRNEVDSTNPTDDQLVDSDRSTSAEASQSEGSIDDERRRPRVDALETEDREMTREEPRRRRPRQEQRPRRRQSNDAPLRRSQPEWKDFGDLEDQLMNGSRPRSAPPRRRNRGRISDEFDEDY